MGGCWNKVLRVDLTTRRSWEEKLDEAFWSRFLGGAGFGAKVLLEETAPQSDPLGPANRLVFGLGPLQATNAPGSAKWTVAARSPLTGTYGEAAAGADWGQSLKKAGWDALVVQGRAGSPSFLWIDGRTVEIRDARDLWGLDAYETCDRIHEKVGDERIGVVTIGQAGEGMVAMACLVADKHSFAGRCGMGAVMGSKNLKAIAVRGRLQCPIHDAAALKSLVKKSTATIRDATRRNGFREHGTPGLCVTAESLGDMPIKNWAGDSWPDGAAKLGAPRYTEVLGAKPLPCLNCPIGCHRAVKVTEPGKYAVEGCGPEYETLGMLGTNCLIDDPLAIAKANDRCNRLGLDTISAGAAVGFTMECFERGWLSARDLGGLTVSWGDADAAIALIEKIAARQEFGDALAGGVLAAARTLGKHAEAIVSHAKGLEYPSHDPRSCFSLAPTYATTTRGACHMRGMSEDVEMGGFFLPELGITKGSTEFFVRRGKGELAAKLQDYAALLNSLVICAFMPDGGDMPLTDIVDTLNAATGWSWSLEQAMLAGERIFTLQRLVNLVDGHGRSTDVLPPRTFEGAKVGFRAGRIPAPFDEMLDELYQARGWNHAGRPTPETLHRLGLEEEAAKAGLL